MQIRNLLTALLLVVCLGNLPTWADNGSAAYQYLIAVDFLCGLPPDARGPGCPAVTSASNGDTIEVTGSGTLSVHAKGVTGGGTFTHKNASGGVIASGSWAATKLISFHSYGDATPQGLASNFEGGLALIEVRLSVGGTPVAEGVLRVDCALGKPPASSVDGIRLAVQSGPNFNKEMTGFTLFIRQP